MSMKMTDLHKQKGKKLGGGYGTRGGQSSALDKRDQAAARKRELLEKQRKSK